MRATLRLWTLLSVVFAESCGSTFPDPFLGTIEGRLFYSGEEHTQLERPAVVVLAFASPLEWNLPTAIGFYPNPVFGEQGLPYELGHLDPYSYTVLATLIDLDNPGSQKKNATGFFPNLCEAMIANKKVEVDLSGPVLGIDIHLYDEGGMSDPCLGGG